MVILKYTRVLILAFTFYMPLVFAEEITSQASQLSELVVLDETTSFRYQETRYLELLDTPWSGNGLLLVSKDGTLVKLQMQPHRKIMAITPGEMIYFDSESSERHRLPLAVPSSMSRPALIFQQLMQGHLDNISAEYDIAFHNRSPSWSIEFTPKSDNDKAIFNQIIVQGSQSNSTRSIVLNEAGGDSSKLTMHALETGQQLEFMIERLLQEAVGQ